MDNLGIEYILIHQEFMRREASISRAIRQAVPPRPNLADRMTTSLGNMLISLGTRMKERTSSRLTTEGASAPSFLIML